MNSFHPDDKKYTDVSLDVSDVSLELSAKILCLKMCYWPYIFIVKYGGEFIYNGSVVDMSPGHYGKVNLDDMQLGGAPVYRLSMIAEAYATKGTNTNSFILFLHSYVVTASSVTAAVTILSTWWQHSVTTKGRPGTLTISLWSVTLNDLPLGLCLEKVPAASPSLSNKNTGSPSSIKSISDREQEIITCYEKSGDIALLYLQEAEKVQLHKFLIFSQFCSVKEIDASYHQLSC